MQLKCFRLPVACEDGSVASGSDDDGPTTTSSDALTKLRSASVLVIHRINVFHEGNRSKSENTVASIHNNLGEVLWK